MNNAETYNHRLVKSINDSGEIIYGVHEIHYDLDNNIVGWNPIAIPAIADSPAQIQFLGEQIIRAAEIPTLILKEDGSLVRYE